MRPSQCLAMTLLMKFGPVAATVHSHYVCAYRHFAQISYDYTLARTAARHRAWLRALPEQERLEIEGRHVLLCHGSPRRVNEFLWDSGCSDAFLDWLCDAHAADVILCTHTGLPWHRHLPSGRDVVNVGAIGRPANDGRTEVSYALLDFNGSSEGHSSAIANAARSECKMVL